MNKSCILEILTIDCETTYLKADSKELQTNSLPLNKKYSVHIEQVDREA